jgi:hypothetical protein
MFTSKDNNNVIVQESTTEVKTQSDEILKEGKFIRMTYIVNADFDKKMKMIAAKNEVKVKDLNEDLSKYLAEYEDAKGAIEV